MPRRGGKGLARRTPSRSAAGRLLHVVFTLPAEIADIARQNKAVIYDLLFRAASEAMLTIATDPDRRPHRRHRRAPYVGFRDDPSPARAHVARRRHLSGRRAVVLPPRLLPPVRVLSKLFRRLFLAKLTEAHAAGRLKFFGDHAGLGNRRAFAAFLAPLRRKNWFVYAKPPFAGPKAVLAYLSRYTHRVAISNSRLISLDEAGVTFRFKNYAAAAASATGP